MSDSDRLVRCGIYLCRGCREPFDEGDEVVALSDGIVYPEDKFDVENRRMWHLECFLENHPRYRSHWKPPSPDDEPIQTDGGESLERSTTDRDRRQP